MRSTKSFAEILATRPCLEQFQLDRLDGFAQQANAVREDWSCLNEVLLPSNLSSIHEFEAYYAYALGDADRVESAVAGWLNHTPFDALSYTLNNTVLAEALIRVADKNPSLIVPFTRDDPFTTTLDGRRTNERHIQRGALPRRLMQRAVQQTTYVHAGQQLPNGWVEPHQNINRFGDWRLAVDDLMSPNPQIKMRPRRIDGPSRSGHQCLLKWIRGFNRFAMTAGEPSPATVAMSR